MSIHKWLFSAISAVKIFVFLDLAKTISFLDGHYLSIGRKVSMLLDSSILNGLKGLTVCSGSRDILDPARCPIEFLTILAYVFDQMDSLAGILDTEGRIIFVNQTALRSVGASLDEVIGIPFHESPWLRYSEAAKKTSEKLFARALTGEAPLGEIEYVNPDGEVVPALYSISPIRDAKREIIALVPEAKVIADLQNLVVSAPLGIIYLDENGRVLFANPEMELKFETVGIPKNRIKGKRLIGLGIYPADESWSKMTDVLKEEATFGQTKMILLSRGRKLQFEVHSGPLTGRMEGIRGSVLIMKDVTERNRLEAQLLRTRIQTEKMSALGLLISGVAHEINNPLTSIIGCAEYLVEAGQLDRNAHEAADIILSDAKRAARIAKNLLTFARESPQEIIAVHIDEVVTNVLAICIHEMRNRDIRSIVEFGRDIRPVEADRNQLQQAILNIISNAMDAIEESEVGDRITIRTRAKGEFAIIQIENNGPPIPEEHLSKIFDPFFTTKEPGRGTGLGLSIAYGIVEKHNGTITVDTSACAETRFNISLPLSTSAVELSAQEPSTEIPYEVILDVP